jgi:signal transduction histidine kinase/CheY-like chemotaxis protein
MGLLHDYAHRAWRSLTSVLLHSKLSADADRRRRAELALGGALVLLPLLLIRAGVFLAVGATEQMWITAGAGLLLIALLLSLGRTASMVLVGNLFTLTLAVPGISLVVARGGFDAPMLVALSILPLVATFLAGWRSGLAWAVAGAAVSVIFAALAHYGFELPDRYAGRAAFRIHLAGLLLLPFATFGLALAFELTKNAARRAERVAEAERARAEAEAQLMRADRLASMGQLVAGVAHEINNPLTYVVASIDELEEALVGAPDTADPAKLLAELRQAQVGLRRIQTIVRDLKTFTRPKQREEGSVELRATVEASARIVENELRHKAQLQIEIPDDFPRVRTNEAYLGQVILNLLLNGVQAIDPGDPARDRVTFRAERAPDGGATLEVADTGSGMSEEVRERALDPFFTTKPVGVGTGLGLSVCANIVRSMGGKLTIESEQGAGTLVRIELPADRLLAPEPAPQPAAPAAADAAVQAPQTSYDVLVVDDDALVARAVARALRAHRVVIVNSGEAALGALQVRQFDVIVCDLMMPGLSGADVYERVARDHPGLERKLVFLSGGALGERTQQFVSSVPNRFLQKPVETAELELAVAEAGRREACSSARSGFNEMKADSAAD